MFSKHQEAKNGTDWEWHLIGRRHTLKMRVQAKRVQRDGVLKVKHRVASSGRQQRKLLLDAAHADRMKPLYCIYSTERQRSFRTQPTTPRGAHTYKIVRRFELPADIFDGGGRRGELPGQEPVAE